MSDALRRLREVTKDVIAGLGPETPQPVLDVGPMVWAADDPGSVFRHYPDTFIDARTHCQHQGLVYRSLDRDPTSGADLVGDFLHDIPPQSVGTLLLLSVVEHTREIWLVREAIINALKPGGQVHILVPFNLEPHSPFPDYWRSSSAGLRALLYDLPVLSLEDVVLPDGRVACAYGVFQCPPSS